MSASYVKTITSSRARKLWSPSQSQLRLISLAGSDRRARYQIPHRLRAMSTSRIRREISTSHDMNGENATLMTRQEVIDEIADDRVGFVAELCHNPAGEHSCAAVPFEIDRPMRGFAVDFSPSVRAAWTQMFSGN